MGVRNTVLMACCAGLAMSVLAGHAAGQEKALTKSVPAPVKVQPAAPQPAAQPAGPAAAPAQGQPQISFDKTVNDFGVINDDNPVSTEFKFTNTGSGTLEISNVQGSCG